MLSFLGDGSFASLLEKIGGKMSENIFELVLKKFDLHVSSKFIILKIKYTLFAFEMDFLELLLHFCLPTLEIQPDCLKCTERLC